MEIIWDELKRISNIQKHRLDFASLTEEFFAAALVRPARGGRHLAIGEDRNGVLCVVFAAYGLQGISIVSMRPASKTERELYREHLKGA